MDHKRAGDYAEPTDTPRHAMPKSGRWADGTITQAHVQKRPPQVSRHRHQGRSGSDASPSPIAPQTMAATIKPSWTLATNGDRQPSSFSSPGNTDASHFIVHPYVLPPLLPSNGADRRILTTTRK